MINDEVFIVLCTRKGRSTWYYLDFPYNKQLVSRISNLPKDERKFLPSQKLWLVKIGGLLELLQSYRKSKKIHFDFGVEEHRQTFIELLNKHKEKEKEKQQAIEKLAKDKKHWLDFKKYIEKNYEKYSDELHSYLKPGIRLYRHQITAALFANKVKNALISHEMGLGKAQDVDSKLLTPNGWIRMGDIRKGDYVIGSDGKPKKVLGVFPQGLKDIYEICFNDGTSARSCDEHLWNVNTYIRNWRKNPFMTKTLREIMDSGLQFENGNNRWYIPIVKPIELEEKNLIINPYVLGCLLGDGCITVRDSIGFSSIDKQILNEIQIRLPEKHNLVINGESHKDYYLTADGRNNLINQELKKLNLKGCNSHNKFIPNEYKLGSIYQRLEMLQGILDTDGHSRKDSIVELTLVSKQLINDVQFIVESLGGIGRISEKWVNYNSERRLYWRINIKLPPEFTPFKLQRKIETFVAPTKYPPNRAITEVNYVGEKEAQCILIDSEDHLYVTDHCILTHNTLSSILYVEMNGFEKVFVITPNSLKFNYFGEVEKFTNSKAHIVGWKKNKYTIEESKYIIVNYEFFNTGKKEKMDEKWKSLGIEVIDSLVLDECHRIKNTKSNTYKNYVRIFKDKIFRNSKASKLFLSGTPAPNRAYELYTVMKEISPLDFPTKEFFYNYYCGMTYDYMNGWGYVVDEENTKFEELFHKIAPYTHRKRKSDLDVKLPEKTYQRVLLEMSDAEYKKYRAIEDSVVDDIMGSSPGRHLSIMGELRQYLSQIKTKPLYGLITDILDNTDEKVVIVDVYKKSLYDLNEMFDGVAALHTGDQTVDERNEVVKKFQDKSSHIRVFLGSIQTCNYGLTLTQSSKLFLLTLPFIPGEFDQVSDRLHRIGQKQPVNIYSLVYDNTVDTHTYSLIENKREELSVVMDNEKYTNQTVNSVFGDLVKKLLKGHGK